MNIDSRKPRVVALSAALSIALLMGTGVSEARAAVPADVNGGAPATEATLRQPVDFKGDGFTSMQDWHASMGAKRSSLEARAQILLDVYGDYASDAERAELEACAAGSGEYATIADADAVSDELDDLRGRLEDAKRAADEEAAEQATVEARLAAHSSSASGLTQSSGVCNFNGRRETYYSSRALYHYRTGEWMQDAEGFWRDSEGYYVVAASDMPQGTVFQGSKGDCKVYDSGCAAGTTDYYVSW